MLAHSNFKLRIPTFHIETSELESECALLDAIYVPTQSHRPPLYTEIELLLRHTRHLVLLFTDGVSDWSTTAPSGVQKYEKIAEYFDIDEFHSLSSSRNTSSRIMADYDIPAKRNFALQHAAHNGYRFIGLLDDDIELTDENLLLARMSFGQDIQICSFHILDCPDVSTIDHIERISLKKPASVSIGGNCLFFDLKKTTGFFPRIYNDDWFFIFSNLEVSSVVSGGIAKQRPYEPWTTPRRVEFEQLGDVLIEGAKANIIAKRPPFDGSLKYWQMVLTEYHERLVGLAQSAVDQQMRECVERGIDAVREVSANSMLDFLNAYLNEQGRRNGEAYARSKSRYIER